MRYRIYCDGILIHDTYIPDTSMHLISPKCTLGENTSGCLSFAIAPSNPGYNIIKRITSTLVVYEDNEIIWTGRVISQSEDFKRCRSFTCEGALAFLNDSITGIHTYHNMTLYNFLKMLIDNHNAKMTSISRKLSLGVVTVADDYENFEYQTNNESTWEVLSKTFIDRLGGHMRVRYSGDNQVPILDYYEDYPNTATQEINFGINLIDFTRNWDMSDIATAILPRGKELDTEGDSDQKEYTTIKSVNNGSEYYVNQNALNTYGRIERVVDFNDIDTPELLLQTVELYAKSQQFDTMVLDVSAVDLHNLNPSIRKFSLIDIVRCESKPHGLDKFFPITAIDIDINSPSNTKYTMGSSNANSLSANSVTLSYGFNGRLNALTPNYQILNAAKEQASSILNQRTTGYINIVQENDISQALIISNTENWTQASKMWKFDMNGLGYSNHKVNGVPVYDLAITMDGTIVADFIKTGVLSDGVGLNYWNLTTGEFSLSYDTNILNNTGNAISVLDIVNLAQDGYIEAGIANANALNAGDAANSANETATLAKNRQTGGDNILNGTNKTMKLVESNSDWKNSTWDSNLGSLANKTLVDVTGVPNSNIKKGVVITLTGSSSNVTSYIRQRNVEVLPDQVYTLSCYAKKTPSSSAGCSLMFGVGNTVANKAMYANTKSDGLKTAWVRYGLTFKTGTNGVYVAGNKIAGIVDNKCHVEIGIFGNRNDSIIVCGMKLERGNAATDWSEPTNETYNASTNVSKVYSDKVGNTQKSYTDSTKEVLKTYSKQYTDTISKNDREFTKNQRIALDESFTQAKIFNRLTQNGRRKGIYLQQNELYMNATYVRTGTLDAGIIKAGILTDKNQNNKWNMATGYLYTNKMEAVRMRASGRFECGTYYKITLDGGSLDGYHDSTWVASISPTANFLNVDTGRQYKGLQLRASGSISFRAPQMTVRKYNDNGIAWICYTGDFKFDTVERIESYGDGSFSWWTASHCISVTNGLITTIW